MWFGSRNGLHRFDGTTFKIFRNYPGDKNSIGNNSILSLQEDERRRLWVGTYTGVYMYDPIRESFSSLKAAPPGEVRFIEKDKRGNLWFISNFQLYSHNTATGKTNYYPFKGDQALALHVSGNGTLWVGTTQGYLKKFNGQSKKFKSYHIPSLYGANIPSINSIYSSGDTTVTIGTTGRALSLFPERQLVEDIFKRGDKTTKIHVHTILPVSKEELWLGSEDGIHILNRRNNSIRVVSKEIYNPYSISDNVISALYKDKEGGIWVGTYFGGINHYSQQFSAFKKHLPNVGSKSISGNLVHEIVKDKNGYLWIGTEDAGLNRLNPANGEIKRILPGVQPGSISYHNIHGLATAGNELWIGTYEHGLDVLDINTNKVIRHYKAALNPTSFHSDFIVTLYRTRNAEILVGTWNGLFRYNRSTDDFSALPFFNAHIQSIHEDNDGTLWVGTYGSGVFFENKKLGKRGKIESKPDNPNGLISNYVNSIFQDSQNNFWFCTESGLSRFFPATGKILNLTRENGLPDNQVFKILEEKPGKYWISTSKGLSEYTEKRNNFFTYHTTHGLPTEQFNYNSAFKNSDGTMFFGTLKGLIEFNPKNFIQNKFIPPVYITGLQINNEDVVVNDSSSILDKSIIYTKTITLPHDKSTISIDVAALSYLFPTMNTYSYKLQGLDKNWVSLSQNRKIYYTQIPPGDYTFKVKGSNSYGRWNPEEATLRLIIKPPIWATSYAYSIYLFIVLAVIATIFWNYRLFLTEKNKRHIETLEISKEREIYNAKIDFFTNVAHEIRTPLTLIKMPLEKLSSKQIDDPETIESINMMKKNTNRLIDLTNQLLDFRKAEANKFSLSFSNTNINELLADVYTTFKAAAEQKTLSYNLEMPRIALQAFVDEEAMKKIISNLTSNAIKYADKNVLIKLLPFSSEDHFFNIEFRNDGNVIPAEYNEKIFEPFFRLEGSNKEEGTGIGLPLSRSLTELHKGSLTLVSSAEQLNMFLLSIPIHQDIEITFPTYESPYDADEPIRIPKSPAKDENAVKPSILIVEDNKEILHYLQKELSAVYNVKKAFNGQEALDLLINEHVQLVISDIMMPVMDGISLCKKMKSDFHYSHIPIILLTAKNSINSKIEGLEVGADAYIEKPFSFEYLLAQINSLLVNRNNIKEYFARSPLTHIKGMAYSKTDKEFLEKLNAVIYENITDIDLDVDQLSSMMNMSRPTLYRKIKGLSNLTPNELINVARLKRAAELLAEGDFKINEVSNMVGYTLPTNFSRDFQKQFGLSPSAYLSSLQKDTK